MDWRFLIGILNTPYVRQRPVCSVKSKRIRKKSEARSWGRACGGNEKGEAIDNAILRDGE
jgi:hypothetical protein